MRPNDVLYVKYEIRRSGRMMPTALRSNDRLYETSSAATETPPK
jgi:hypothetical protein